MENIFIEIIEERERQTAKWGEQNHPILDPVLLHSNADRMTEEINELNRSNEEKH